MFKVLGGLASLAGILLTGTVVFGSWYHVDQGERGVVLRNGAFTSVSEPNLHFKLPIIDSVHHISVREQYQLYPMQAYSRDQQVADVGVSVTFRVPVDRVADVYSEYGSVSAMVDRLLTRTVNDATKTVFGLFNAASSIQERARLNQSIEDRLREAVGNSPIEIVRVNVEDIAFSDAYERAVEARMEAEVQVFTKQQELEQQRIEAQIAVTQAQGRADSVVAEAEARANATRIQGDAEAAAITARGDALRENPELVQLITAENWNGVLPTTMLPGSTVPFLDLSTAVNQAR